LQNCVVSVAEDGAAFFLFSPVLLKLFHANLLLQPYAHDAAHLARAVPTTPSCIPSRDFADNACPHSYFFSLYHHLFSTFYTYTLFTSSHN